VAFLYNVTSNIGLVLPAPLFVFLHLYCWPKGQDKNVNATELIPLIYYSPQLDMGKCSVQKW